MQNDSLLEKTRVNASYKMSDIVKCIVPSVSYRLLARHKFSTEPRLGPAAGPVSSQPRPIVRTGRRLGHGPALRPYKAAVVCRSASVDHTAPPHTQHEGKACLESDICGIKVLPFSCYALVELGKKCEMQRPIHSDQFLPKLCLHYIVY